MRSPWYLMGDFAMLIFVVALVLIMLPSGESGGARVADTPDYDPREALDDDE